MNNKRDVFGGLNVRPLLDASTPFSDNPHGGMHILSHNVLSNFPTSKIDNACPFHPSLAAL